MLISGVQGGFDITPYLNRLEVYKLAPLSRIPFTQKLRGHLLKKAYRYYERKTGENPFSVAMTGLKGKKFSIRMVLLYLYGEVENRLVVGAANKSEYQIGYFVKHGCDHATDIMPLLGLYKTQVRELARYLEIPSRIIEKPPSLDILPGITDEEAIGISYEKLDLVLLALERGLNPPEIAKYLKIPEKEGKQ